MTKETVVYYKQREGGPYTTLPTVPHLKPTKDFKGSQECGDGEWYKVELYFETLEERDKFIESLPESLKSSGKVYY